MNAGFDKVRTSLTGTSKSIHSFCEAPGCFLGKNASYSLYSWLALNCFSLKPIEGLVVTVFKQGFGAELAFWPRPKHGKVVV